jgi:glutamate-1-semialdehyde aminotransferase
MWCLECPWFAKAISNGFPMGAILGRRSVPVDAQALAGLQSRYSMGGSASGVASGSEDT